MIFTSLSYLIFLILTFLVYYLLPGRFRWACLLFISVVFYLSFIPVFLLVIAFIVIGNYLMSFWLKNERSGKNKKIVIILIVTINLLILAFFKYFNSLFPNREVNLYLAEWFSRGDPLTRMIIPVGLSYMVFTVLSYQIEIKRGNILPERHLGYFSLYLLFFPKVTQGPIERPEKFLPQLRDVHNFNYSLISSGLKKILLGYFKKLVVADRLSIYVNAIYNNSEHHNGTTLIVATVFFAFQIYADFSGYTDIALGSASLFGYRLSENFKSPYLATSVQDFWSRWHMTFSTWLRDYIFLPLAFWFSKSMKKDKYFFVTTEKWIYFFAIMITFAVCGIWHGEGLNYLIWGLLFGLFLTVSNWTVKVSRQIRRRLHMNKSSAFYRIVKMIITFSLVSFCWIFFRAKDTKTAFDIISQMMTTTGKVFYENPSNIIYAAFGILTMLLIDINSGLNGKYSPFNCKYPVVRYFSYAFAFILILLIGVLNGEQFIYVQF
jgi:alginate O-acetyltransferase complex protein AlgI